MIDRRRTVAGSTVLVVCVAIWIALRVVPGARQPVHLGLVLALGLLGGWLLFERFERDDRPARPPEPETVRRAPVPGAEIDRLLDRRDEPRDWATSHVSKRLRERLGAVALDLLVRYDGLTRAEAQDRLADGSWTEDPVAAAFLAGRDPPVSKSLRDRLDPSAPTPFVRVVRRSVDALLRRAGQPTADRGPSTLARLVGRVIDRGAGGPGTSSVEPDPGRIADDRAMDETRGISHWRGIAAFALLALAAGVALEAPALLLGGAIGVGYTGYASLGREPTVELHLERSLSDAAPRPGDDVVVSVAVTNESDRTLSDVRLVDGVPPSIGVVGGSPRHATALRPGERARFAYVVEARRGVHRFLPATVLARDLAETVEVESAVAAETSFVSRPRLTSSLSLPLRERVATFVGGVPTRTGGEGVEFHSVRGYRRGDPLSRVDWRRLARTGELATVALREERAANVVVVIDSRESAYRAPEGATGHACDRSVTAAAELIGVLLDSGNRVGVATLHPEPCWLPVRTGSEHRSRIRDTLATHPSVAQSPPDGECYSVDWLEEFRARYDAPAQVLFLSPLCDETASYAVRTLEIRGYPVTLVSVDPTGTGSPGQRFARLERLRRLYRLRTAGARVVDWQWDEPAGLALVRAARRWRS